MTVDDLIDDSGIEQLLTYKFALNQIDSKNAKEFGTVVEKSYEELTGKIRDLFNKKVSVWNEYLSVDGAGIQKYIKLMLKGNLITFG